MGPKRRRGRRGRIIIMGLVLIGAGLVVFRYSAYIAGQLDSYISPPPTDGNNITGLVSPGGWYLPYAVWGFGFTLIGLGGTMPPQCVHVRHDGGGRRDGRRVINVPGHARHVHAAGPFGGSRFDGPTGNRSDAAERNR